MRNLSILPFYTSLFLVFHVISKVLPKWMFFVKAIQKPHWNYRSSHQRCFSRKYFLRNFAKFTEKHLRQSLFFSKVAGLRPATLLKKRLWHRCFPINFAKFPRTPFLTEHLRWLPLKLRESLIIFELFVI